MSNLELINTKGAESARYNEKLIEDALLAMPAGNLYTVKTSEQYIQAVCVAELECLLKYAQKVYKNLVFVLETRTVHTVEITEKDKRYQAYLATRIVQSKDFNEKAVNASVLFYCTIQFYIDQ